MPVDDFLKHARRVRAILEEEGLAVLLGKLAVVFRQVVCRKMGWAPPYRARYSMARDDADRPDWVLALSLPRPDWWPIVHGVQEIRGAAWSANGIAAVEIELDGRRIGNAELGCHCYDADLPKGLEDFGLLESGGFRYLLDVGALAVRWHRIVIRAKDSVGRAESCGFWLLATPTPLRASQYPAWIERCENAKVDRVPREPAPKCEGPRLSVIMPVYNTQAGWLRPALDSVRSQSYSNWELCIGDDGSTSEETLEVLREASRGDPRIRIARAEKNGGISAASNRAVSLSTGDYLLLMDSDDCLAPNAMEEIVRTLADFRTAGLIYSDEDKIDASGNRYDPFFKPDWSPDLLYSFNYLNHLTAIRADLVRAVGGFRSEYDGSQDYDLFLRVVEEAKARELDVMHVPRVLYHWRAIPGSTAASPTARNTAHDAASRAVGAALSQRGLHAAVEPCEGIGRWRVRYTLVGGPLVSVVLPTGGRLPLLRQCISGLLDKTTYENLEIVLVDNSKDGKVQGYFEQFIAPRFKLSQYLDHRGKGFNYSAMNNRGVERGSGELILLLNDDVKPINNDWIEAMIEHAQRREIGAVGAKLLFPDGRIQHAGVVMGLYGCSGHAFRLLEGDESRPGYFDLPHVVRNCSAVTAACLMMRKAAFLEVEGFDEENLAVAFQDVDLCLKLLRRGYRNVYTPHAKLIHFESVTKSEKEPNRREKEYMQRKWADLIAHDPYYSPHLTRNAEDYSIRIREPARG